MSDVVLDVDQMEAAPLPAPSTSRTPVPRLVSATSSRHSTPAAPLNIQAPRRLTRSRTAAAASASGSLLRMDTATARRPSHHAARLSPKRESSSSDLSPPPDATATRSPLGPTAQADTSNLRRSSGSVHTGEHDVGSRRSPSLAPVLPSGGISHPDLTQPDISRSTTLDGATIQSSARVLAYPPLAQAEQLSLLGVTRQALMPSADVAPTTKYISRASAPPSNLSRKRKLSTSDSDDDGDGQPLLSEYMCPICFSPPKSAVITPCGHILCGACLHGATTARAPNTQPLCPVCRTPIPGLRFAMPEPRPRPGTLPPHRADSLGAQALEAGGRRRRRRHVPPASRTLASGISLPTSGEEMVDMDRTEHENGIIDVSDGESDEGAEDPGRSGVIGLELLTMASL